LCGLDLECYWWPAIPIADLKACFRKGGSSGSSIITGGGGSSRGVESEAKTFTGSDGNLQGGGSGGDN